MDPKNARFCTLRRLLQLTTCLLILICANDSLHAQQTVTGKVVSAKDETPLAGVTVQVKGTNNATATNASGDFVLHNVSPKSQLEVSFVGFLKKTVAINKGKLLIQLEENLQQLNDVVVVGYGTQKKVNLTGAISTLDMTEKE